MNSKKRLIFIRHGESTGNKNGIIQSNSVNYGLTEKGKKDFQSVVQKNIEIFDGVEKILVSPALRTAQTAKILQKKVNVPVYFKSVLRGVEPGILSGMSKENAKKTYPEYYEIWKERKDLDEIPEAETGENLQARLIGFLMQYYNKSEFNDVIVTHAAVIRCLLNTIENRTRTENFNIENCKIYSVSDIFKNMQIELKDRAMNSKVFIVSTPNGKYIAKMKSRGVNKQDKAEQEILNQMEGDNIPKVLTIIDYDNDTSCKMIKYVGGEHIYGKLEPEELNALIESERRITEKLKGISNNSFVLKDLKERLKYIQEKAKNEYVRKNAGELLCSKYSKKIADLSKYILSHDDLNRDNVLFEKDEHGGVKANIIDFESLEYAPPNYQFASMLASGILLEGEEIENIKKIIQESGKNMNEIFYLMQIRLLEGLFFFSERQNEIGTENKKTAEDLLRRYFYASEKIIREIKKKKEEQER